jgi:cytochrome c oxidase subunit III
MRAAAAIPSDLPVGRLGMWVFLVTDAMSFGALLITYGVLRARATAWPDAATRLDLGMASVITFVLLASSLTMALAVDAAASQKRRAALAWIGATILLGIWFLLGTTHEWLILARHGFGFAADAAASTFYACTGWHALHVAVGIFYLAVVAARRQLPSVATAALFWQFLDAVWILLFTFVYLV